MSFELFRDRYWPVGSAKLLAEGEPILACRPGALPARPCFLAGVAGPATDLAILARGGARHGSRRGRGGSAGDGGIYQDAYLVPLKPESEICLIPKIGGGYSSPKRAWG